MSAERLDGVVGVLTDAPLTSAVSVLRAAVKWLLPVLAIPLLVACDPPGSFKDAIVVNGCSTSIHVRLSSSSTSNDGTGGETLSIKAHSKINVPNAFANIGPEGFTAIVIRTGGSESTVKVPNVGDPVTVSIPSSAC